MSKSKKKKKIRKKTDTFVLPSDYKSMSNYIDTHKIELMEWTISSIEYALRYKKDSIELFQFDSSKFVVTLNEPEFDINVDHILQYYIDNEQYELCDRVYKIKQKTENI